MPTDYVATNGYEYVLKSLYTQERERADYWAEQAKEWGDEIECLSGEKRRLEVERDTWVALAGKFGLERDQLRTMCDRLAEALRACHVCYDGDDLKTPVLAEYERLMGKVVGK